MCNLQTKLEYYTRKNTFDLLIILNTLKYCNEGFIFFSQVEDKKMNFHQRIHLPLETFLDTLHRFVKAVFFFH